MQCMCFKQPYIIQVVLLQELDEGTTTIHTDCNVVQVQRAEMSAESSAINSLPEQQILVSVTKYTTLEK